MQYKNIHTLRMETLTMLDKKIRFIWAEFIYLVSNVNNSSTDLPPTYRSLPKANAKNRPNSPRRDVEKSVCVEG